MIYDNKLSFAFLLATCLVAVDATGGVVSADSHENINEALDPVMLYEQSSGNVCDVALWHASTETSQVLFNNIPCPVRIYVDSKRGQFFVINGDSITISNLQSGKQTDDTIKLPLPTRPLEWNVPLTSKDLKNKGQVTRVGYLGDGRLAVTYFMNVLPSQCKVYTYIDRQWKLMRRIHAVDTTPCDSVSPVSSPLEQTFDPNPIMQNLSRDTYVKSVNKQNIPGPYHVGDDTIITANKYAIHMQFAKGINTINLLTQYIEGEDIRNYWVIVKVTFDSATGQHLDLPCSNCGIQIVGKYLLLQNNDTPNTTLFDIESGQFILTNLVAATFVS